VKRKNNLANLKKDEVVKVFQNIQEETESRTKEETSKKKSILTNAI